MPALPSPSPSAPVPTPCPLVNIEPALPSSATPPTAAICAMLGRRMTEGPRSH